MLNVHKLLQTKTKSKQFIKLGLTTNELSQDEMTILHNKDPEREAALKDGHAETKNDDQNTEGDNFVLSNPKDVQNIQMTDVSNLQNGNSAEVSSVQNDHHTDVKFVQNGHPLETTSVQNGHATDVPCLQNSNATEVPSVHNGTIPKVQKRQDLDVASVLNSHPTEVPNKQNVLNTAEHIYQNGHGHSSEDLNSHTSEYCGEDVGGIPFNQG